MAKTNVVWRLDGIYKADANKCYQEMISAGNECTPEKLVEIAKNPDTELHKCFEWDDTKAAERYRLKQARDIMVSFCVNVKPVKKAEPIKLRVMQSTSERNTYSPIHVVMKNPNEYSRLLDQAYRELEYFKVKYARLNELNSIMKEIDVLFDNKDSKSQYSLKNKKIG